MMQIQDAYDDNAFAKQKSFDDLNLTLTERGYRITRTIPHPDLKKNPNRTYAADEKEDGLFVQVNGPAEEAYAHQKAFDDLNLTM